MNPDDLLAGLNPVQQQIVKDTEGNKLVLAGAGSGKTRVLTHRISYLLSQGVPAWQILAVTFTNKAAKEMQERVMTLAGTEARDVWIGTFHRICIRILSRFGSEIGIDKFTIIDDTDQKKIIKEVLELVGGDYEVDIIKRVISDAKNDLVTPEELAAVAKHGQERDLANIYEAYEEAKTVNNYLDYDDCIVKTVQLFNASPAARDHYQHQFRYVMADETQDTNKAQFKLLMHLSAHHENMFAVGDSDQCQPPETIVQTTVGPKRMDELVTGEEVLAWNRKSQYVSNTGYPIEVASRPYNGDMLTVCLADKRTRATPNHKFLVRWTERTPDIWVTYLMYRSDRGYRVGWCQLFNSEGTFHLGTRARLERAEKVWILETHESKKEATVYESITSMKFGIPLAMFEPNNELYDEVVTGLIFAGANQNGGKECLAFHHQQEDLPFFPYPKEDAHGKQRPTYFECYAANLLPGLMSLPLPGNKQEPNQWQPISDIQIENYEGLVYSLDVDTHHNYVADGIVTLNSIYKFRGAELKNIINFHKFFPDTTVYKLEQNYRSTNSIVTASNALIENNKERLDKTAFTDQDSGDLITLYQADDDTREADFVARSIQHLRRSQNGSWSDFAILYRTNRQSREIEKSFTQLGIPYQLVNG